MSLHGRINRSIDVSTVAPKGIAECFRLFVARIHSPFKVPFAESGAALTVNCPTRHLCFAVLCSAPLCFALLCKAVLLKGRLLGRTHRIATLPATSVVVTA